MLDSGHGRHTAVTTRGTGLQIQEEVQACSSAPAGSLDGAAYSVDFYSKYQHRDPTDQRTNIPPVIQQLLAIQARRAQIAAYLPKSIHRGALGIRRRRWSRGDILRLALGRLAIVFGSELGRSSERLSSMAATLVAAVSALPVALSVLAGVPAVGIGLFRLRRVGRVHLADGRLVRGAEAGRSVLVWLLV